MNGSDASWLRTVLRSIAQDVVGQTASDDELDAAIGIAASFRWHSSAEMRSIAKVIDDVASGEKRRKTARRLDRAAAVFEDLGERVKLQLDGIGVAADSSGDVAREIDLELLRQQARRERHGWRAWLRNLCLRLSRKAGAR